MKLVDEILKTSGVNNASYKKSAKGVRWEKIKIPGREQAELPGLLADIIKKTGIIRTLGEILTNYKQNQMSYELKHDSNKPSKPKLPFQAYYEDNKDKINEKYPKEPGEKFNFLMAMKYAKEKYEALPTKKKQPYIDAHKEQADKYKNAMKEFRESCPEYYERKKRSRKVAEGSATLTPFNLYRREKCLNDSYIEALHIWKELPNSEKVEYIKRVISSDAELKKISIVEKKLLEDYGGIPKKPLSAFLLFANDFRNAYNGDKRDIMKQCGEAWKNISDARKKFYMKKYDQSMVDYGFVLEKYVEELPKEQQIVMRMTLKKHLPKVTLNATSFRNSEGTPSKKMKIEKEDVSVIQVKQMKSPKKKAVVEMPPYPSDTTAHHYMMTVHHGDAKKARKAYKKLSVQEKKAYQREMFKAKKEYLETSSHLFTKMPPSQLKEEKANMVKAKSEQREQLDWHKPSGTDNEADDSESDDSDSDS